MKNLKLKNSHLEKYKETIIKGNEIYMERLSKDRLEKTELMKKISNLEKETDTILLE